MKPPLAPTLLSSFSSSLYPQQLCLSGPKAPPLISLGPSPFALVCVRRSAQLLSLTLASVFGSQGLRSPTFAPQSPRLLPWLFNRWLPSAFVVLVTI